MGIEQLATQGFQQALQIGRDAAHAFSVAQDWIRVAIPLGVAGFLGLLWKASRPRG